MAHPLFLFAPTGEELENIYIRKLLFAVGCGKMVMEMDGRTDFNLQIKSYKGNQDHERYGKKSNLLVYLRCFIIERSLLENWKCSSYQKYNHFPVWPYVDLGSSFSDLSDKPIFCSKIRA